MTQSQEPVMQCERCEDQLALLRKNGLVLCYDCMAADPSAHPDEVPEIEELE